MAVYRVLVAATAERQIESLQDADRRAVVAVIQSLAFEPRPRGCRKLRGQTATFRVRVGRYRVLYDVGDSTLTVLVLKVAHRKDVYR